jgi:hypothetical protein
MFPFPSSSSKWLLSKRLPHQNWEGLPCLPITDASCHKEEQLQWKIIYYFSTHISSIKKYRTITCPTNLPRHSNKKSMEHLAIQRQAAMS